MDGRARRRASAPTAKKLRKHLRKAQARLREAEAERDRLQARFEARLIIVDELRARLAELDGQTGPRQHQPPDASAGAVTSDPKDVGPAIAGRSRATEPG